MNFYPVYDITNDRQKAFIEFKVFQNFHLVKRAVFVWLFFLILIMNFCNVLNQETLNIFDIFNIWQFHTHIILFVLFWEIFLWQSWRFPWDQIFILTVWNSSLCIGSMFLFHFWYGIFWLVNTFQPSLSITSLSSWINYSFTICTWSILTLSYYFSFFCFCYKIPTIFCSFLLALHGRIYF